MTETLATKGEFTRQVTGPAYLTRNNLLLHEIHPSQGAKYSPNLYEFLTAKRNKSWAALQHLFEDKQGKQWLGFFDDVGHFVGARLSQILSYGKKTDVTCPVNLGEMREVEGFWPRYVELGRCAIDPKHEMHFLGERWRANADGNQRSCLWCQKATQRLVRREVVVTKTEWA